MKIDQIQAALQWVPSPALRWMEKRWQRIPFIRRQVEAEYDHMLGAIEPALKPYRGQVAGFATLPAQGQSRTDILAEMQTLLDREKSRWQAGYVSGAVYHGDDSHIDFLNQIYALNSQSNPLHVDLWPSTTKFEAEIVSMTAHMLHGDSTTCGTVSSGGTESILLAMKAYRDQARQERGIDTPEIIAPTTAHAAFDKAAQYFNIRLRKIPVGQDFRADVQATRRAINRNTIALIGSAPSFPHGVIDPIEALSELASKHGIGFHTDACLGGFVLPWAKRLGYPVPEFDFNLPGVTSLSADTHKYGYAPKGSSVVLYRHPGLRRYQYYSTSDWPGGLYFSPTFAGSRPGALSAGCWAALVSLGEQGYLDATRRILETAAVIRQGIASIPDLQVLGDPLWVIAFNSTHLDIYRVMDFMTTRGWSLNGLHRPAAIHLCVTLRHTEPGVAERFLSDLRAAVQHVHTHPAEKGGMAPIYGMAGSLPLRGVVSEMLKRYVDMLYKV